MRMNKDELVNKLEHKPSEKYICGSVEISLKQSLKCHTEQNGTTKRRLKTACF